MPDVVMTSVEHELVEAGRPVPTMADVRETTAAILGATAPVVPWTRPPRGRNADHAAGRAGPTLPGPGAASS